ncbi:MAG: YhcH/YjgK/YiaL family protein, partial [Betaproteobacteria bacterium HGW-Betaproteobacteria-17]
MILDMLAEADRYTALHPLFARAFEFLRSTDLLALAPGMHTI